MEPSDKEQAVGEELSIELPETLFDRWIGGSRPLSVVVFLAVILYALTYAAGALEYGPAAVFTEGHWRNLFVSPTIIVYIIILAPWLTKLEVKANSAIAALTILDANDLANLVQKTARVRHYQEIGAVIIGAGIGGFVVGPNLRVPINPVNILVIILTAAAFGLLAWTIQASTTSIKVTATLLKQPLDVNVFDLKPFDAIGQQSLFLALAFVGGITISLAFSDFELAMLQSPGFWLVNVPVILVPGAIFFLNMSPTHRILTDAKKQELETVQQYIPILAHSLLDQDDEQRADVALVSARVEALLAYETRVQQVRTWPYDVSALRALFASFLVPILTVLVQVVLRMLLEG
jgi:hypothetical protein